MKGKEKPKPEDAKPSNQPVAENGRIKKEKKGYGEEDIKLLIRKDIIEALAIMVENSSENNPEQLAKEIGERVWKTYESKVKNEPENTIPKFFDLITKTIEETIEDFDPKFKLTKIFLDLFKKSSNKNQDLVESLKEVHKHLKKEQKILPIRLEQVSANAHKEAFSNYKSEKTEITNKTLEVAVKDFFSEKKKAIEATKNAGELRKLLCNHLISSGEDKRGILYSAFKIQDIHQHLEKNKKKIPEGFREQVISEFKIASFLVSNKNDEQSQNPLKTKIFIDAKGKSYTREERDKLTEAEKQNLVERSWQDGGWLFELRDKNFVEWGLEENDKLLKDKKPPLTFRDGSEDKDLLALSETEGISAVDFCLKKNLQITADEDIKEYLATKPSMAKHRNRVIETLETEKEIDDHIQKILQDPYRANADNVAYHLLTSGVYGQLLGDETVKNLCQQSGIKFNDNSYSLQNLLTFAKENSAIYYAVKNSIAEKCYEKSKELQALIDRIDNPQKQSFFERLSERVRGAENFISKTKNHETVEERLAKYSTAKLEKIQQKISQNGKYTDLKTTIDSVLKKRKEKKEQLKEEQKKLDQIHDLLIIPPINDVAVKQERARDQDLKLLTSENSQFYKLYQTHGAKKLAERFHANKTIERSFLGKVTGKIKLAAAGVAAGAAVGITTKALTNSTAAGALTGIGTGIAAVQVGSAVQEMSDESKALTEAGEIKFSIADAKKYQMTCSAEVRRAIEKVLKEEEKLTNQASYNSFLRTGRMIKHKTQRMFFTKEKELDKAITESGEEINKTYTAFDSQDNRYLEGLASDAGKAAEKAGATAYNTVVGAGKVTVSTVAGFFKGLKEAHQQASATKEELRQATKIQRVSAWPPRD